MAYCKNEELIQLQDKICDLATATEPERISAEDLNSYSYDLKDERLRATSFIDSLRDTQEAARGAAAKACCSEQLKLKLDGTGKLVNDLLLSIYHTLHIVKLPSAGAITDEILSTLFDGEGISHIHRNAVCASEFTDAAMRVYSIAETGHIATS